MHLFTTIYSSDYENRRNHNVGTIGIKTVDVVRSLDEDGNEFRWENKMAASAGNQDQDILTAMLEGAGQEGRGIRS